MSEAFRIVTFTYQLSNFNQIICRNNRNFGKQLGTDFTVARSTGLLDIFMTIIFALPGRQTVRDVAELSYGQEIHIREMKLFTNILIVTLNFDRTEHINM